MVLSLPRHIVECRHEAPDPILHDFGWGEPRLRHCRGRFSACGGLFCLGRSEYERSV